MQRSSTRPILALATAPGRVLDLRANPLLLWTPAVRTKAQSSRAAARPTRPRTRDGGGERGRDEELAAGLVVIMCSPAVWAWSLSAHDWLVPPLAAVADVFDGYSLRLSAPGHVVTDVNPPRLHSALALPRTFAVTVPDALRPWELEIVEVLPG